MERIEETAVTLTQKQVNELEGSEVFISAQPPNLIIRIPFVKTVDITTLNIYKVLNK